jgi:hypothetical protein
MSTTEWTHPVTEKKYDIGTIGLESFKPKGFFDFFQNIPGYLSMIGGIIIPTYGLWAGPGYAGGTRPTSNPEIKWEQPPCMNDSITKPDANPDECCSLVDAITKTHDWRYVRPLKSIHMLRCAAVLGVAAYTKSTPHFSDFARLASERI